MMVRELGKKIMKKETKYVYNELRNYGIILDVGCGIGPLNKTFKILTSLV